MSIVINLPNKNENNNLFNQVVYKKLFTPEECQKIINFGGELNPSPVQISKDQINLPDLSIRNSYSKDINLNSETYWSFKKQINILLDVNEKKFNFRIDSFREAQILKYEKEGFFNRHVDIGTGVLSTRKISLILFLSDRKDYEGGQLILDEKAPEIDQEQGSLFLFPSYISHEVTKITVGTRYTMVSWAHGPHFS